MLLSRKVANLPRFTEKLHSASSGDKAEGDVQTLFRVSLTRLKFISSSSSSLWASISESPLYEAFSSSSSVHELDLWVLLLVIFSSLR